MGAFIGRHVCGVGPNYPPEVKKNETMRLGLEDPAAYTDDGWPYQSLAIYGRLCSGGFFFCTVAISRRPSVTLAKGKLKLFVEFSPEMQA
jgi:hypothetical protein